MFIDTHAHIPFEKSESFVKNAKEANVNIIVNASEDLKTSITSVDLSKLYDGVYACIGVHPEHAKDFDFSEMDEFRKLLKNEKVVAIGEIGLDYYYGKDDMESQKRVFKAFLELAKEVNKPVVIHTRDAVMDTINILKEYNLKGIIHCFSSSKEVGMEYIKLGYKLGIGGVLTFKNSNLRNTVKSLGLENLVLETDSPFLSPEPYRGKENESKNIPIIAKVLADSLGQDLFRVEEVTTNNAIDIFDIH